MALLDRINLPRGPLLGALVFAAVWVGFAALFGSVSIVDWLVAGGVLSSGVFHQWVSSRATRSRVEDREIYGPPEA